MLAIGCHEDSLGGTAAGITVSNILKQSQRNAKQIGERWTSFNVVCLHLDDHPSVAAKGILDGLSYALPSLKASSFELQFDQDCVVLDDEFSEISRAHGVVLDMNHTFEKGVPLATDVNLRNKLQDSGLVVVYELDLKVSSRFVGFVY